MQKIDFELQKFTALLNLQYFTERWAHCQKFLIKIYKNPYSEVKMKINKFSERAYYLKVVGTAGLILVILMSIAGAAST